MENIEVLPGVRLDGRLAEQVPRPVKNVMVMAYCAPLPIETAVDQDYVDFLIWSDWTEIREDGTFTFDSLPQKGKVQVIALCDGWIGKTDRRTVGEQITLEEKDWKLSCRCTRRFKQSSSPSIARANLWKTLESISDPFKSFGIGSRRDWGGATDRSILYYRCSTHPSTPFAGDR